MNFIKDKVIVLTIPKAGTHMLKKAIEMMTNTPFYPFGPTVNRARMVKKLKGWKSGQYIDHLMPEFDFLIQNRSDRYQKVLLIRDLRDVAVSQVHWMERKEMAWMPTEEIRAFNQLPFDERLSRVFTIPDQNFGIKYFAAKALQWVKNPTVLVIRFEDLIGLKGGGTDDLQKNTLQKLADHLKCSISPQKIEEIGNQLFGGTFTFSKGQIGTWKSAFQPHHIELFKNTLGTELHELGYQIDLLRN